MAEGLPTHIIMTRAEHTSNHRDILIAAVHGMNHQRIALEQRMTEIAAEIREIDGAPHAPRRPGTGTVTQRRRRQKYRKDKKNAVKAAVTKKAATAVTRSARTIAKRNNTVTA